MATTKPATCAGRGDPRGLPRAASKLGMAIRPGPLPSRTLCRQRTRRARRGGPAAGLLHARWHEMDFGGRQHQFPPPARKFETLGHRGRSSPPGPRRRRIAGCPIDGRQPGRPPHRRRIRRRRHSDSNPRNAIRPVGRRAARPRSQRRVRRPGVRPRRPEAGRALQPRRHLSTLRLGHREPDAKPGLSVPSRRRLRPGIPPGGKIGRHVGPG